MTAQPATVAHIPDRQHALTETWFYLRRSLSGMIGLVIVILHLTLALVSPVIVPYDSAAVDATAKRQPPSLAHPFGTDHLGRDVFTRTLLGGRVALVVTLAGTALAVTWGGLWGILLGFVGGWFDELAMRLVDALLALPGLLLLLLVVNIVGTEVWVFILTLGFLYSIAAIRIARATTLDFVTRDFILAARARGERRATIIIRELLPNVLDVLMVEGALRWSWMLLTFSSLSFLGFGIAPPTPDWGVMIANNREIMALAPWATFFPIAAISSLIIGANLLMAAVAKAIGLDRIQGVTG